MVNTAENQDMNVRLSALQTLGFLADELESRYFTAENKSKIIEAIVKNLDSGNQALQKISVKAFYSALHLADENFRVQEQRDFIMQKLFEVAGSQDEDIQEIIMQIFVDVCKHFYEYVAFYFD